MDFEIEEWINPTPWQAEWRCKSPIPGNMVDREDMCVRAIEIPESEEG